MRNIFLMIPLLLLALALPGCETLTKALDHAEEHAQGTEFVVKYGILKYTGRHPGRAQSVYDYVKRVEAGLENESVTVGALDEYLRGAVNWENLDMADQLAADTMLKWLNGYLQEQIGDGLISSEDRVRLSVGAQWVKDAALMAGARDG